MPPRKTRKFTRAPLPDGTIPPFGRPKSRLRQWCRDYAVKSGHPEAEYRWFATLRWGQGSKAVRDALLAALPADLRAEVRSLDDRKCITRPPLATARPSADNMG